MSTCLLGKTPWFFALLCYLLGKRGFCAWQLAPPGFSTALASVIDRLSLTLHEAHPVDLFSGHP